MATYDGVLLQKTPVYNTQKINRAFLLTRICFDDNGQVLPPAKLIGQLWPRGNW